MLVGDGSGHRFASAQEKSRVSRDVCDVVPGTKKILRLLYFDVEDNV